LKEREMAKKYTIILEPNYPEEGYTVRIPALPGCITYGRNKEEALERAKEAIEGFIEGLQKAGELVPEEVTPVEMDITPLGVIVTDTGKQYPVSESTPIIADCLAKKGGYPDSIFSMKTWIGGEQLRETFAYAYFAMRAKASTFNHSENV
jgi:predicted RNase H-like HicB family nuclease